MSRRLAAALSPALALLLVGCVPAPDLPSVPVPADAIPATVERVVDGDTVVLDLAGRRERVRLLRIDAPELGGDGQEQECLAERATRALEELLPAGTAVQVGGDVEARDRFGRLLVHLWVDGTWVNGAMLRQGMATVLTIPPNVAHDDEVLEAQRRAEAARAGLWDPDAC